MICLPLKPDINVCCLYPKKVYGGICLHPLFLWLAYEEAQNFRLHSLMVVPSRCALLCFVPLQFMKVQYMGHCLHFSDILRCVVYSLVFAAPIGSAGEQFIVRMAYGGGQATAHDVFLAMQEIPFILRTENTPLVIEEKQNLMRFHSDKTIMTLQGGELLMPTIILCDTAVL